MEDWRTGSLRERSGRSDAVLLKIARQRIWVHWFHWMFPLWNFIGGFVSAIQIRDWRPLAAGFGIGVVIGIGFGAATGGVLFFLCYLGSIPCAFWTQQIIQDARDEIDRKNRR